MSPGVDEPGTTNFFCPNCKPHVEEAARIKTEVERLRVLLVHCERLGTNTIPDYREDEIRDELYAVFGGLSGFAEAEAALKEDE